MLNFIRRWRERRFEKLIVKELVQIKGAYKEYHPSIAQQMLEEYLICEQVEVGDKSRKWDAKLAREIVEEDRTYWDDPSDPTLSTGEKLCA